MVRSASFTILALVKRIKYEIETQTTAPQLKRVFANPFSCLLTIRTHAPVSSAKRKTLNSKSKKIFSENLWYNTAAFFCYQPI